MTATAQVGVEHKKREPQVYLKLSHVRRRLPTLPLAVRSEAEY